MKFDDNDAMLCEFLSRSGSVGDVPSLADGTEVGEWRITGFIGRGGSSEVYCVRNKATGEPAALKVLHRTERRHNERFAREAHWLEELTENAAVVSRVPCGRHFPRFYGKGTVAGRPYVVIELLEPLPLPHADHDVARYLCAVAEGLGDLHVIGIVHRDIKPGNILWRTSRLPLDDRAACPQSAANSGTACRPATDEPVIIDLGLVKDISPAPMEPDGRLSVVDGKEVGVGTPRYAAPEQFSGGEATPAMDIHALGRLAYECFGGKPPRIWSNIIRRATSSIPGERYQTAADFIRAVCQRHRVRNIVLTASLLGLMAVLSAMVVVKNRNNQFLQPHETGEGVSPDPENFPERIELSGYDLRFERAYRLKGGMTYRVIGPGILDASLFAEDDATVWITNCVVNNHAVVCYPKNRVKYILAGDAYLNLANVDKPASPLVEFIKTPDGADHDCNNMGRNRNNNDIRFRGPETLEDLIGLKASEYFRKQGFR